MLPTFARSNLVVDGRKREMAAARKWLIIARFMEYCAKWNGPTEVVRTPWNIYTTRSFQGRLYLVLFISSASTWNKKVSNELNWEPILATLLHQFPRTEPHSHFVSGNWRRIVFPAKGPQLSTFPFTSSKLFQTQGRVFVHGHILLGELMLIKST